MLIYLLKRAVGRLSMDLGCFFNILHGIYLVIMAFFLKVLCSFLMGLVVFGTC